MIQIEDKFINPAQVAWISEIKTVARSKPPKDLPPVYSFMVKAGWDTIKSRDYDTLEEAQQAWEAIEKEVQG